MITTVGSTKSGKKVYLGFNNENHKNFTPDDHEDASRLCDQMRESLIEEIRYLDSKKERDQNSKNANKLYKQSIKHEEEYYKMT